MDQPSTSFSGVGQHNTSALPLVDFIDLTADLPVTPAELDALERLLGDELVPLLQS